MFTKLTACVADLRTVCMWGRVHPCLTATRWPGTHKPRRQDGGRTLLIVFRGETPGTVRARLATVECQVCGGGGVSEGRVPCQAVSWDSCLSKQCSRHNTSGTDRTTPVNKFVYKYFILCFMRLAQTCYVK